MQWIPTYKKTKQTNKTNKQQLIKKLFFFFSPKEKKEIQNSHPFPLTGQKDTSTQQYSFPIQMNYFS